jgi:hypothetical protein
MDNYFDGLIGLTAVWIASMRALLTGLGFLGEFSKKIHENSVSLMKYCARDNINFFVVSKAFSAKKTHHRKLRTKVTPARE